MPHQASHRVRRSAKHQARLQVLRQALDQETAPAVPVVEPGRAVRPAVRAAVRPAAALVVVRVPPRGRAPATTREAGPVSFRAASTTGRRARRGMSAAHLASIPERHPASWVAAGAERPVPRLAPAPVSVQ